MYVNFPFQVNAVLVLYNWMFLKYVFKDIHVPANLHVIGLFEMASKIFFTWLQVNFWLSQ